MKTFLATLIVAACSLVTVSSAKADDIETLDRLATRLEAESRTLYLELRHEHEPNLRVAAGEVLQLYRRASRIHAMLHRGYSLHHVHADVAALESLVEHVHEHLAAYHHYDRHVHRLESLVSGMDDVIHHIEDEHYLPSRPIYAPCYGGGGINFGGSGFSIRIGR